MYYTQTADRLTRTSVWLDKMEGGIQRLREIIIDDALGICEELERMMQHFVDTYKCEWKEVVNDPEKRKLFKQFANTDETEPTIEFVKTREQKQPAAWSANFVPVGELTLRGTNGNGEALPVRWVQVGKVGDFPKDGGATIKYGKTQIAVFNFASRGAWYATQNMCPHRREFVLSRGMVGDQNGVPKVACPVHKKTFSLETGQGLSDKEFSLQTFPVKIEGDDVYLQLPPIDELDAVYATDKTCNGACHAGEIEQPRQQTGLPTRKAKVNDPFAVGPLGEKF
jgi:nitrite reductase (NADH) large subunit